MKIYSNVFDLARPVSRQIYVAPNSVYAFGIKIVNAGVPETDFQLKVFQNGVEIAQMGSIIDGFKLYQRTSPAAPTSIAYDVVYIKGSKVQHFDLVGNTTNSTVFDIDQKGGALDLPIASASVLGGVKVGNNLTIDAEGKLSIGDTVALKNEIPTKTSELTNDSNFATVSQIPTAVGQLENNAGYVTSDQIPTKLSQLENDANYTQIDDIPKNISQLENDVGYITSAALPQNTALFEGEYEDGTPFSINVYTVDPV